MQKNGKEKVPIRVIPEFRSEIDVSKLCRALILTAKEQKDTAYHNKVEKKNN